MAALYPGTTVSGYNANPPPDDGSTGANNLITWAMPKTKLGDPLNNFASAVDSNITSAFGKTLDGATVVSTAFSYAAAAADQGRLIKATASGITITVPPNSVAAPFTFGVTNQSSGTITLAGNSSNVDGAASQLIQPGGGCILKFDGTNWFSFGLTPAQVSTSGATHGFDMPVNLGLTASVGSSILTVAVKTKAGNDPSAGDPVLIPFRDSTIANGGPIWVTLTGALNITTNAIGATLGTTNSVPFRFWIVAFNNGGSIVLGLWHSGAGSSTPVINSLNESALASSTGISAAATSAGVIYTPNGVTVSGKPFRIIGFLEYSSGLATAGTYSAVPTTLQLFGPGIPKPGSVVQTQYQTTVTGQSIATSTLTKTALSISITPSSAANPIIAEAYALGTTGTVSNAGSTIAQRIARSSAATAPSNTFGNVSSATYTVGTGTNGSGGGTLANKGIDLPGTTSSTPYSVYIYASGTCTWLADGLGNTNQTATFLLTELTA